jgi:IS5 family transposase
LASAASHCGSLGSNESGERDPERKQRKKGRPWHSGVKVHIGVDAQSGLVHSFIDTAGCVNDVVPANSPLQGQEARCLQITSRPCIPPSSADV